MAEVVQAQSGKPKQKEEIDVRRPKKRPGVRIDMTPLVDVAFLLLIFFMVTTVFRRPLAMEVNMPKSDAKVQVPESNVMSVYIDHTDSLYYKVGKEGLAPITWRDLPAAFTSNAAANPDLIVLVKIDRQARYEDMVDMLDALDDAQMQRFSLVPLREDEAKQLEDL
jgi:biopolymer transport protein ExbD